MTFKRLPSSPGGPNYPQYQFIRILSKILGQHEKENETEIAFSPKPEGCHKNSNNTNENGPQMVPQTTFKIKEPEN